MSVGSLRSIRYALNESASRIYFNVQGEMFKEDLSGIQSRYIVESEILEQKPRRIDDNMRALENLRRLQKTAILKISGCAIHICPRTFHNPYATCRLISRRR